MNTGARKAFDLAEIRAEGWFEQLGEEVPEFEQLCQVVGKRFVAFSFVTNARISSIAYDPQAPHSSLVDFVIGEDEEVQRLTLADFRERLGNLLLAEEDEEPEPLAKNPGIEDVRRHIGRVYLLLAPVFGIKLIRLNHGGDEEATVELDLGHTAEEITVAGLRDILNSAVRSEVARARPSAPFSIDFNKVSQAEAANARGDFEETISLLGAWPGPLSMFLRTPQGQALGDDERGKLVRGLGALGHAYLEGDQGEWAEDVLRLGIQFGQELESSGRLFGLLGKTRLKAGRHGEAIGLIRRALALGGEPGELLLDLARCFVARDRYVAAMACLEDALEAGVDPRSAGQVRSQVEAALGGAYHKYREAVASRGDS